MNNLDRADAYLAIPQSYADSLGIRWSKGRDAIERRNETVFAFSEELLSILDGVFANPPAPHFALVLTLLDAMKRDGRPEFSRLHRAFEATRGGVGRRNVGLLIAELCRELPSTVGDLTGSDIANAVQWLRLYGEHLRAPQTQEPPLTRQEFEQKLAARLARYTDDDLRQWLTHGTGPSPAGEQLAEQTESLPARVARLLALAKKRQRLVGAAVLVPAIDAGLTLPPRRRSPNAPPQGGYCDVTNRGEPEQLLPTQFALEPDEFIRRFASRELLYFQKEEPHQPELPERVIVLDQGVRTWGSVRLALAAAAFSLLVPKAKRCASIKLFLTSVAGALDITAGDVGAVADLLEASDLTANPRACLLGALRDCDDTTTPRDIILLTHPRAVRELSLAPELARRPNDRLFALAVDDRGRAELHEWINGSPTAIRSFRVDLAAAEAARADVELPQPRVFGAVGDWSGDVEPMPFPFRPGLVVDPQGFGFDADGEWCVIVGPNGALHGLGFDGSPPEVLPRACHNGIVLRQVDAILGVSGGVVVCGRMVSERTPDSEKMQQVAAHYDRATRNVKLHWLGPALFNARWSAYPDLHSIAVRAETVTGCALDLGTGGRYPTLSGSSAELVSRARVAWDRSAKGETPPHTLLIVHTDSVSRDLSGRPHLFLPRNQLRVVNADPPWSTAEPRSDGKPLLDGANIHSAQLAGSVLAVAHVKDSERRLLLFRGPDGNVLGEVTHPVRNPFTLSADGRFLARRDATRSVVVSATSDVSRPLATASHASLHNSLDIRLDAEPFRLTIAIGTFAHTFRVHQGELRYSLALGWDNAPEPKQRVGVLHRPWGPVAYDPGRFPPSEGLMSLPWCAVLDRLGQVLLFAKQELVAVFLVRRDRAAAWLPGGVFWGTPALIGGPATPDAEKRIGRAIEAAGN